MSIIQKAIKQLNHRKKVNLKDMQAYMKRERVRDRTIAKCKIPENAKCEKCNTSENLTRHHTSYSPPKKFIILCRPCHDKVHATSQTSENYLNK